MIRNGFGVGRVSTRYLDRVGVNLRDVLLLVARAREDDGAELAEADRQLAVRDPAVFAKTLGDAVRPNALRALVERGVLREGTIVNVWGCCNVGDRRSVIFRRRLFWT